jgi:hypothetical protein
MASFTNPNINNTENRLALICGAFDSLCNNIELQRLMSQYQTILSTYYIKNDDSPIDYHPNTYSRLLNGLTLQIGNVIRSSLSESNNASHRSVGTGMYGLLYKNKINTTKVIKHIQIHNSIENFNLFNEYIIQKLLHHKVNEINSTHNIGLKMYIPNVYSFTKKGGNTFTKIDYIKMNYIDEHISLFDYITTYTDSEETLFANLNNLIATYISYLRILQNEYSFVHYDMNLNNILLKVNPQNNITEFYLIDFGQSYINFNNYHFFGTVNHAYTTSLHSNFIYNKYGGFWKSIDIIFLLLMIIYRIVEKNNYIKIENEKKVINIDRIISENPVFYNFINSHFINIELFKKMFSIIYTEPTYFKYLILNFNHGINIFLTSYPPISQEDQKSKINYIINLFQKFRND